MNRVRTVAVLAAAAMVGSAHAAWKPNAGGTYVISDPANWTDGKIAGEMRTTAQTGDQTIVVQ